MRMLSEKDSAARQLPTHQGEEGPEQEDTVPKSAITYRRRAETRLAAIAVTCKDADPYADPPCTD